MNLVPIHGDIDAKALAMQWILPQQQLVKKQRKIVLNIAKHDAGKISLP